MRSNLNDNDFRCFKICLAKQMDQKPHEALDYCRRAISVCERRLERLQRELPTGKVSEPNKGVEVIISEVVVEEVTDGVKVTSKIVVEGVTDGVDVAQLNDSTPSLEADVKDVEDVEKPVSTENATERVTDGDVTEAKDVELSPEEELKAEVKEIEELLVDLRERVSVLAYGRTVFVFSMFLLSCASSDLGREFPFSDAETCAGGGAATDGCRTVFIRRAEGFQSRGGGHDDRSLQQKLGSQTF